MHIYVHIPFCESICPYCSFYKHVPQSVDMAQFIDALTIEAHARRDEIDLTVQSASSKTLYMGGGTPSMLSNLYFKRLVLGLGEVCDMSGLDEFSFEANPRMLTASKAEAWCGLGVSRVSLGVQSWDERILEILGRDHSPSQAASAFQVLRREGMRQINMDLMFAIPGQSLASWRKTLEIAIGMEPDHISAYNLMYEEDTEFFSRLMEGGVRIEPDEDAEFFRLAHSMLASAGYRHYETSNYARNGRISLHNMGYWMGENYVGLGPGAVSTIDHVRVHNTEDTQLYINSVLQNGIPARDVEHLSDGDKKIESIGLRLRTDKGISLCKLTEKTRKLAQELCTEGLAEISMDDQLILTVQGGMLADEIAVEILTCEEKE